MLTCCATLQMMKLVDYNFLSTLTAATAAYMPDFKKQRKSP
jgi:hypothetical protein